MAITIDGTAGTIAGVAVGGLPDGIVDGDMLAANAVTTGKILNSTIASGDLASGMLIDCDADSWFRGMHSSYDYNTDSVLDFGWHNFKTGSNVSESGGTITVGTAGWYLISLSCTNNDTVTDVCHIRLRKNSSDVTGGRLYWDAGSGVGYHGKSHSWLVEAAANDTFQLYGYGYFYGSATAANTMTTWLGIRLGA
jgi:hypothetical protein